MEEIIPFDKLAQVAKDTRLSKADIDKLNHMLIHQVNRCAGVKGERLELQICFGRGKISDFPLEQRIAVIAAMENAGYKRVKSYGSLYDVFKLPLSVTTLLPDKSLP